MAYNRPTISNIRQFGMVKLNEQLRQYLLLGDSSVVVDDGLITICDRILELVLLNKLKAMDDKVYVMKTNSMSGRAKQPNTMSSPPIKQHPIVSNVPKYRD